MVMTIYGEMDENKLELRKPVSYTEQGTVYATEYYLEGELVHRSIHFVFNEDAKSTPVT